jgi:protein-tyrosine phosphatase
VIDLHCHILPGLDDGPADELSSVALAQRAYENGIRTIVATPHVREDYPFKLEAIAASVARLRHRLRSAAIPINLVEGAELALTRLPELDDRSLGLLCLGDGRYVLIESPSLPVGSSVIERPLFELQTRGFGPVLAHPERSPAFLTEPDRLRELVRRRVLCSVTAGSIAGRFGRRVRRFAVQLFREGLVHNVASDAHSADRRPPSLMEGVDILRQEFLDAEAAAAWFTVGAPAAILAGRDVGEPPRLRPAPRLLRWAERDRS